MPETMRLCESGERARERVRQSEGRRPGVSSEVANERASEPTRAARGSRGPRERAWRGVRGAKPLGVRLTRGVGRIALAAVAWTSVGVLFALPALLAGGQWRPNLFGSLAQWWAWGLLAPLIVAIDRRLPSSERQLPRRVLLHVFVSGPVTAAYVYVFAAVRALVGVSTWRAVYDPQTLLSALSGMFLWSWLVYWLIVGAWQAYQYYQRYLSTELRMERLERRFTEARLNALRMQLDPHFLFNALNTISSQVERDPRMARAMIERLGDLLRLSLESRDKEEIPLAEEMAFLDHYLAIQRIRFRDRLTIETDVDPTVAYATVPCFFMQPLVENAIRHGISPRASGGIVTVSAQRVDDQLRVLVVDDGVGLPPGWSLEESAGLGLSLTRDRIAGLYPDGAARLEIRRRREGGTEVAVTLPLRVAVEEDVHDAVPV
jgi:two-component system, LytTR family, sensor kinase